MEDSAHDTEEKRKMLAKKGTGSSGSKGNKGNETIVSVAEFKAATVYHPVLLLSGLQEHKHHER